MSLLLGLCLLASSGAPPDVGAAIGRLLDGLALDHTNLDREGLGGDLALRVGAGSGVDASLAPRVRHALALELAARGLPRPLELEADSSSEQAVAAGAEWLLAATLERRAGALVLSARLLEIDRGLFEPAPDEALSLARAEVELGGELVVSTPPPDNPKGEPGLEGPAVSLAVLDEPVIALAACGPAEGPELLLVLSPSALRAYALNTRRLEPLALEKLELPPAPVPTREPFGRLVCGDVTPAGIGFAFGHGRMAGGRLGRLDPKAAAKSRIVIESTPLPGLPLAFLGEGRFLVGASDEGRSRLSPALAIVGKKGESSAKKAPAAYLELFSSGSEGGAAASYLGVDERYQLFELDAGLAKAEARGRSGVGGTARTIDARRLIVRTAWTRGPEEVGLVGGEGAAIKLEGPVLASTIGRFGDGSVLLVLAVRRGRGTALMTVRVVRS